ncbi:MAG TPA: hypothetical protein VNX25_04565 [Verrucomicrobiae bacterium]|nr:hypothetical protein [Verrucomicrobiae bacterium]
MNGFILLAVVIMTGFVVNVPLGYIRQGFEKFSFGWYFYVHISIPLIIYLRIKAGFSWKFIPLTVAGAIAGQVVGGILHRKTHDGK